MPRPLPGAPNRNHPRFTSICVHLWFSFVKSTDTAEAALSDLEIESIEYFVSFVQMLGLPKSVGEIYGVLFVSADPMALDDVVERLRISKGSASQGLNVLRNLGAIVPVYVAGDRRDHFEADFDLLRIANRFFTEKLAPRLEHGKMRLDRMESLAADCAGNAREHPAPVRINALRKWQRRGQGLVPLVLKFLGNR